MRKIVFQEKAIANISGFLSKKTSNKVFLNSPTGSGKTYMVSRIMDELASHNKFTFIFIAPSTGDLLTQGFEKVSATSSKVKTNLLNGNNIDSYNRFNINECSFIGWSKIKNKNKETGDYKNVLMREGEKGNIKKIIKSTKCPIILFIDESHIGSDSERSKEIIGLISPEKVVFISATTNHEFNLNEIQSGKTMVENIEIEEVRKEGLIKSTIALNRINEEDILKSTFQKLIFLNEQYKRANLKHKPLLLIQISNGQKGSRNLGFIKSYISENYPDFQYEEYISSTDVANKKEIRENIKKYNSKIDVLFFKQAIATGWDIPRAHILLKYRNSGSEILDVQTLGRILRVVNGDSNSLKEFQDMNTAFIFTTAKKYVLKWKDLNAQGENNIKDLFTEVKDNYREISLPSYYRVRNNFNDLGREFLNFKISIKMKINANLDLSESVVANSEIPISHLKNKIKNIQGIKMDSEMISDIFDSGLKSILNETIFSPVRSYKVLRKKVLNDLFKSNISNLDIAKNVIKYWNKGFYIKIKNLLGEYEKVYKKKNNQIKKINWKPETEELSSSLYTESHFIKNNNIMNNIYIRNNTSDVEKKVAKYVSSNYDYWYWNKEGNSKFFAIIKENGNLHYPDIIAWKNKKPSIIEVKQGFTMSTAKDRIIALRNYSQQNNIKSFIATIDGEIVRLEETKEIDLQNTV